MPITQFTTTPLSTEPTNFSTRMDTRIVEQQNFVAEANAMALEMNLYALAGAGAALAPSGFKNKIMGGDFSVNPWQRGVSFAAAADATYTADRWQYGKIGTAIHTITKALDAPTALQAGFFTQHCLGLNVTTAQASFAAGDFNVIGQKIEGFNSASFGLGQAGSRFITKTFWVKAAKTGIHCVSFRNSALNRSYVKEYTINAINTWEFKVITIPVDTGGTWLYDNGIGLNVNFALGAGTSFQTTANAWQAGNFLTTAAQVNELDTIGNNFKIALVQNETGNTATQFESRSIGQELSLCERYTEQIHQIEQRFTGNPSQIHKTPVLFKTSKRVSPTILPQFSSNINTTTPTATGITTVGFDLETTCDTQATTVVSRILTFRSLVIAEL